MVGGGNTPYLSYWFEKSGFAEKLPALLRRCVADEQYGDVAPFGAGSDFTLRLIPVVLRPRLDAPYFDRVSVADMVEACAEVDVPVHLMDDQTAPKIVDDQIDVVSEGNWKLLKKWI
jgi:dipeptidase E